MQLKIGIKLILISLVSSVLLSGCGNSTENSSAMRSENGLNVGTNGQLVLIQSDNVRAAGYDEKTSIMIVQFNNGYTYEYYGVKPSLWDDFISAQPHPWSTVGYPRLVQGGVPYKRIR